LRERGMDTAFTHCRRMRGAIVRGLLGAMLAALGGGLLIYAGASNEIVVIAEADRLTEDLLSPQTPSPELVALLERVRQPEYESTSADQIMLARLEEMTVPEPTVVLGVSVGALERLRTGEIRMTRMLDGAYFCPS